MRVSRTATVTATGVPGVEDWWLRIFGYWWLLAGAGILIVVGAVAYQESEKQKRLALGGKP